MAKTSVLVRFAAIGCMAAVGGTAAPASNGTSFTVTGRVPTICEVSLTTQRNAPLAPGENRIGVMTELCNNVGGYRLILAHPQGFHGGWILVDDRRVPIAEGAGQTVIIDSNTPGYAERQLGVYVEGPVTGEFPMTLYAEPKGPIF
jgi:hypothetical protein